MEFCLKEIHFSNFTERYHGTFLSHCLEIFVVHFVLYIARMKIVSFSQYADKFKVISTSPEMETALVRD